MLEVIVGGDCCYFKTAVALLVGEQIAGSFVTRVEHYARCFDCDLLAYDVV
jgi:hypothetical protein